MDIPPLIHQDDDYDSSDDDSSVDEWDFDSFGNDIERKKVRIKIQIPQSMQRKTKRIDAKKRKTKIKKPFEEWATKNQ